MRFLLLVPIDESATNCYCCRPSNRLLCLVCGLFQMVIAALSLSQHVYSLLAYNNIFLCRTNITDYRSGSACRLPKSFLHFLTLFVQQCQVE